MSIRRNNYLSTPIEFVKGVGPKKAELLQKEIQVFTVGDFLMKFPFRYIDRTQFLPIHKATVSNDLIQIKGKLVSLDKVKGKGNRFRLTGLLKDASGFIELIWFQGVRIIEDILNVGDEYIVFGKVSTYGNRKSMVHPEMESTKDAKSQELSNVFAPVYSSTEKLNNRGIDNRARRRMMVRILEGLKPTDVHDPIPLYILDKLKLCSKYDALQWIHFPKSNDEKEQAQARLKFEELFFLQLRILLGKENRKKKLRGAECPVVGSFFNQFYSDVLPFPLTGAQKRVIKEIRMDMGSGMQMNRLLQGDVGSGKTIVSVMTMLLALDNGYQSCLMAPTEILAQQHVDGISKLVEPLGIRVAFLSGSVKGKKRKAILEALKVGDIDFLIGTHALIEKPVVFKNLGLAVIDEQHRFGVQQRARLWMKNETVAPHILVMTATPIPRTLAMTVYGDLDVSVIDEMPPGRKEVKTIHRYDSARSKVYSFIKSEIDKGRQIYVVYPLIEESEHLDLRNLQDGYDRIRQFFKPPYYQISVVHGRMKPQDKDFEMQRFVNGETQIMVATTVIEVGVNVPNASVMIIENAERFGLSQLHQLRGRVGRGADQSYCILMSGNKISKEGKERLGTMVRTTNGFEIAEADLKLRGPGDIEGTMQSGLMDLRLSSLVHDTSILNVARHYASLIADHDPELNHPTHQKLKESLSVMGKNTSIWGRIS